MARDLEAEEINRRFWDEVAPVHGRSYNIGALLAGGHHLDPVQVRELGDIRGKRLLHLQCHIGTDTLALARLGAEVTGVDFSAESLRVACDLARRTGISARFVHSPVFDLPDVLEEEFDLVYTSIGVLCWISDLDIWAGVINRFMKPGGSFYLLESHPFLNVFDDQRPGLNVAHPYFTCGRPTDWPGDDVPDYSDSGYVAKNPTREFTWTLGDLHNSILSAGLRVKWMHEFDFIHWKALESMVECEDGMWRLPEPLNRIPLLVSIAAVKPAPV